MWWIDAAGELGAKAACLPASEPGRLARPASPCAGDPSVCLACANPGRYNDPGRFWNGTECAECLAPGCTDCAEDGQTCLECIGEIAPDADGLCPTGDGPGCRAWAADGKCLVW